MKMIDKNGLRLYLNEDNKIVVATIYEYTEVEKSILFQNQNDLKKISYGSPFCPVDFSMITKLKNLEELDIDDRYKVFDVTFANEIKKLKGFGSGKFTGSLNNKSLQRLAYKWHKKSDISKSTNIEGIVISNCTDLKNFIFQTKDMKKLKEIVFWKISSLSFPKADIETSINRLEFLYCPKLEDLEELPSIFPMLVKLRFDHCKNIQDYSVLAKFKNLKELFIENSAPIEDFSFLKELKSLSELRIGKTRITAKNIEILDEIPAKVNLALTGI